MNDIDCDPLAHITTACWLVAYLVICTAAGRLSVDISRPFAHVGENITVFCRAADMQDDSHVDWFKSVTSHRSTTLEQLVATRDVLTSPYAERATYRTLRVKSGNVHMHFIYIYGVTYEDTGVYGCFISPQNKTYSSKRLEVYKGIDSVSFVNQTANASLAFRQGEPRRVYCRIRGSVPPATARFLVGGDVVTDDVRHDVRVRPLCVPGDGAAKCPLHYVYDVIASATITLRQRSYDGSDVTCEARVPGSHFRPVSATATIRLAYSPQIDCGAGRQVASRHDHNTTLTCRIHASPLPRPGAVIWSVAVGEFRHEIHAGEKTYGYHVTWKVESGTEATVSLVIDEVFSLHFTTYKLFIRDDAYANVSATVVLVDGNIKSHRWTLSAARHIGASLSLSLTSIALLLSSGLC